ncbi:hypothetical protein AX15_000727 [Amanita polypyramis BW_CC]|nr:hypothetical protein AX15_000727 [Amanita polypyramis BW_CC]
MALLDVVFVLCHVTALTLGSATLRVRAIKERKKLHDVDEASIKLWQVSVGVEDGNLEENLKKLTKEKRSERPLPLRLCRIGSDLQLAIKEDHIGLENIDATKLKLWVVSILDGNREDDVKKMMKQEPLASTKKLLDLFLQSTKEDYLYIIVWHPLPTELTLSYWIIGDNPRNNHFVTINSRQRVKDLRKAIKEEENKVLQDIDVAKLKLWQVSLPTTNGAHLQTIDQYANKIANDPALLAGDELSDIFLVPPREAHLHIIVWYPLPLEISVWLVGDDPYRRSLITVYSNETVEDLQRAVQKVYGGLENIGAMRLELWKASLPTSDSRYGPKVEQRVKETRNEKELPLNAALSILFPGAPARSFLHILVWYPVQLKLSVWIAGGNSNRRTTIEVNSGSTVKGLLLAIKAKLNSEIDSELVEAEVLFKELKHRQPLSLDRPLSTLFPKPPTEGDLHIIAWHRHLSDVFTDTRSSVSPSNAAKTTAENLRNMAEEQKDSTKKILKGRPRSTEEAIPVALLHPILGRFVKDCKDLVPSKGDNDLALALLQQMPDLFESEASRVGRIRGIFKATGITLDVANFNRFSVDLCRKANTSSSFHNLYFIMEGKNEISSTQSEPYIEACFYYLEANRAFFDENGNMTNSRRPCLLMIFTGSRVGFSSAVWRKNPVIQQLTPTLPLHCHAKCHCSFSWCNEKST